jgi:hypothetical protein
MRRRARVEDGHVGWAAHARLEAGVGPPCTHSTNGASAPNAPSKRTEPVALLAIIAAASFVGRRQLLANTFSRRSMAMIALYPAASVVNRVLCVQEGVSLLVMVRAEALLAAVMTAASVITIAPRVATLVPFMVFGIIFAELEPAYALAVPSLLVSVAFVFIMWALLGRASAGRTSP